MKSTNHLQIAASILADTSRILRMDFRRRAQHLNLTQPQWQTLLNLSREPGINQANLAEQLDVNPVTVAQSVDRLVKAGLVLRERRQQDRRAVSLFLTSKAEPLLEELNVIAAETREVAFAGFSAAEAQLFEELLLRVKMNFCNTDNATKADVKASASERSSKEDV